MGNFINNRPVSCIYCGMVNNHGKETSTVLRNNETLHECKWCCSRCGRLIRRDNKIEKTNK